MIYDNYDNLKLLGSIDPAAVNIYELLSQLYQGSVIIITRLSQVQIGVIQVRKLENMKNSIKILLHISRQELIDSKEFP